MKVVFDLPDTVTANRAVIDAAVAKQRASVLEVVSTFSKRIGADKITSVEVLGAMTFSYRRHVLADTVAVEVFVEPDVANEIESHRPREVQAATVTSLDSTSDFAKEPWHVGDDEKVNDYTISALVKYKDANGVESQALLVPGGTPKLLPLQSMEEHARKQNPNVEVITASDLRKDQKKLVAMRNSNDSSPTISM
ncbi:MAG TPA: hypothetical protein VGZ00_09995 [Candidatus Baltobacteraceae bacterium]|nr:hypothetical protein [Candidatus Baltobacteraceae bacterium]